MMLYVLVSLLFSSVFSQPSGEGGDESNNEGGGDGEYGTDTTDTDYDDYCEYAIDMSECVAGGYNGTCIWGISNDTDTDCGQCGGLGDGTTCEEIIEDYGYLLGSYTPYCEYDNNVFEEVCEFTTTPEPSHPNGGGEDSTDNGDNTDDYDCSNEWEDTTDCDDYAQWNGTIVATTTSHNFRWLCFTCDWDGVFEIFMPDALLRIEIEADCYDDTNSDTDTDTHTDTDTDYDNGEGDNNDNEGGNNNDDEGGEGDDTSGEKRRLFGRRRRLQPGGEDGEGGGDTKADTTYDDTTDDSNTDGEEYEITITVEAYFQDCRSFDGISSKFTALASDIEEYIDDITVTVECSKLDCCVSDDYCSSFAYCDNDGDGVYDTYDTDGDGEDDQTGVDVNGDSASNASHVRLTFVMFAFSMLALIAF